MERTLVKDKRNSRRITTELSLVCSLSGRNVPMWTQNVSLEGMFLYCQEYVRLRSVFEAMVWLDPKGPPIRCFLTACFVDRTRTGYGIGVCISGMASDERRRWEAHYQGLVAAQARKLREAAEAAEQAMRKRRVLVLDQALPVTAIVALERHDIVVYTLPYSSQLIAELRARPVDIVIADLTAESQRGVEICQQIRRARLRTHAILLTANASPREFLIGLYAGATQVIAKPCSHELLVTRIQQLLNGPPPEATALIEEDTTNEEVLPARRCQPMPPVRVPQRVSFWRSLLKLTPFRQDPGAPALTPQTSH